MSDHAIDCDMGEDCRCQCSCDPVRPEGRPWYAHQPGCPLRIIDCPIGGGKCPHGCSFERDCFLFRVSGQRIGFMLGGSGSFE